MQIHLNCRKGIKKLENDQSMRAPKQNGARIASVRYQTVGQNTFSFEGFSLSNLWKFTLAEKSWLQHKNAKLSDQSRYCMVHSAHAAGAGLLVKSCTYFQNHKGML